MKSSNNNSLLPYRESHPFPSFIPSGSVKIIIGSFPPIKLTRKIETAAEDPVINIYNRYLLRNRKTERDIDFYYGSEKNLFWKIMSDIFGQKLSTLTDIKALLEEIRTGLTDVYEVCVRKLFDKANNRYILPSALPCFDGESNFTVTSADSALFALKYRNIPDILRDNTEIRLLFFTSSYVWKEFRRAFPGYRILKTNSGEYELGRAGKFWKAQVLPSPSGAANKSIGKISGYKEIKLKNPEYNTYQYRLDIYRKALEEKENLRD